MAKGSKMCEEKRHVKPYCHMEVNQLRAAEVIILTEGHEDGWNSNSARAEPACQGHLEAKLSVCSGRLPSFCSYE